MINFVPDNKYMLSSSEIAVLNLLAEGVTLKEIMNQLNFTERTINSYVHNVCQKTYSKNRTEALAKYVGYVD